MKKISIKTLIRIALIVTILSVLCVDLAVPVMAEDPYFVGNPTMPPIPGQPGQHQPASGFVLGGILVGGGIIVAIIAFIVICVVAYVLLLRPRKKVENRTH